MTRIDVRSLPPGQRHQYVIAAFESLQVGDTLELTAPHEPRGVRLEFEDLYRGTFRWQTSPPDPSAWRVEVQKIASTSASEDVETIAAGEAFSLVRVIVPAGTEIVERNTSKTHGVMVAAGIVSCGTGEAADVLSAGSVKVFPAGSPYTLASENGATVIVLRSR